MEKKEIRKRKKLGQPPGDLANLVSDSKINPGISFIHYDIQSFGQESPKSVADILPFEQDNQVKWINIIGQPSADFLRHLNVHLDWHPLLLEDIHTTDERPMMDDYGDYIFLVLHRLNFENQKSRIDKEQINIILSNNSVVSIQEGSSDLFNGIKERITQGVGRIRKFGADYLAYALMDVIIDQYFELTENISDSIEKLEHDLISAPDKTLLNKIHKLRRELVSIHHSIWPTRDAVNRLVDHESDLIQESTLPFLRDLYDNILQINESIEIHREMLISLLDLYLSSVSNRMNEVMKVLTIISTIFIPLTFIVGIYGMNFEHMPELGWTYGYPLIWGIMILVGVIMIVYFNKKKWF